MTFIRSSRAVIADREVFAVQVLGIKLRIVSCAIEPPGTFIRSTAVPNGFGYDPEP